MTVNDGQHPGCQPNAEVARPGKFFYLFRYDGFYLDLLMVLCPYDDAFGF